MKSDTLIILIIKNRFRLILLNLAPIIMKLIVKTHLFINHEINNIKIHYQINILIMTHI